MWLKIDSLDAGQPLLKDSVDQALEINQLKNAVVIIICMYVRHAIKSPQGLTKCIRWKRPSQGDFCTTVPVNGLHNTSSSGWIKKAMDCLCVVLLNSSSGITTLCLVAGQAPPRARNSTNDWNVHSCDSSQTCNYFQKISDIDQYGFGYWSSCYPLIIHTLYI